MASIKMIDEKEATGKVNNIYDQLKESLGIDSDPNMYNGNRPRTYRSLLSENSVVTIPSYFLKYNDQDSIFHFPNLRYNLT